MGDGTNSLQETHPAVGRTEPRLWFQRFVIWEDRKSAPIQDPKLRKGLNIIWSPRRAGTARLDAGHTSFVRLLRYCLGEKSFGLEVHESKVRAKFKSGAVGAEIVIDEVQWSVVRSLRDPNKSVAAENIALDKLWDEFDTELHVGGFLQFEKALRDAFFPAVKVQDLMGLALGFVARDHDGGFSDVFTWHANNNNSGRMPPRSGRVQELCRLTGFTSPTKAKQQETPVVESGETTEAAIKEQTSNNDVQHDVALTDQDKAEKAESNSRKSRDRMLSSLTNAQKHLNDMQQEQRSHELQIQTIGAEIKILGERIKEIEQERKSLSHHRIPLNTECLPSQKELLTVLNNGCLLKQAGCDPMAVDGKIAALEKQLKKHGDDRLRKTKKAADLRTQLENLKLEIDTETTEGIPLLEKKFKSADVIWVKACGRVESFQRGLGVALAEGNDPPREPTKPSESNPSEKVEPSPKIEDKFRRACQRVVHELVSKDASIEIRTDDEGHEFQMSIGGEQSGSGANLTTVLAFDFAVLLRSIEGAAGAPGLLIHDEPRQQDMTDEEYWRLFKLARKLEKLCPPERPLFQYFITTASPPPIDERGDPFVVLKLDPGMPSDEGLLFKSRLATPRRK
jgi:hypothetical protein